MLIEYNNNDMRVFCAKIADYTGKNRRNPEKMSENAGTSASE